MKYLIQLSQPCPTVREMTPVTATALKNHTADVLDEVGKQGTLAITRHNKPRAVLMTLELFEELTGGSGETWLDDLHKEYQGVLESMQSPEQKEAAHRAFNATPEELGQAALAAAKRRQQQNKTL
jgi:antitoxin Phd